MKRRSFFQVLSAVAAACFLPPLRAAQAVQRRIAHVPRWLDGKKRWEHLPEPLPLGGSGPSDAKIVCRVFVPTHFHTDLHPEFGGFEAALDEVGWSPKEIERRVSPSYGHWGLSLGCQVCSRRVWLPNESGTAVIEPSVPSMRIFSGYGWQIEKQEGLWTAHCPDHHRLSEAPIPVS